MSNRDMGGKLCEACKKRKATQTDIYLSMYLCDDCYSAFDTINITPEELEALEFKLDLRELKV